MVDLLANTKAFYSQTARDIEGAARWFGFAESWGTFYPYDLGIVASLNPRLLVAIQSDDPGWELGETTEAASDTAAKAFYASLTAAGPLYDAVLTRISSDTAMMAVTGIDQDGTHYDGYIDMLRAAIQADDPEWEA